MFKRLVLASLLILTPYRSYADSTKEFLMACTYGVLTGTLVGAATLAFRDKPGDNLKSIARGASLGLYAGILLGVYVVYFVPTAGDPGDPESPADAPEDLPKVEGPLEEDAFRPVFYPIFSENNRLEGAGVDLKILTF